MLVEFLKKKPESKFSALEKLAFGINQFFVTLLLLSLLWWLGDRVRSFFSHFLGSGAATPWSFSTWYQSLGWLGKLWWYYGIIELGLLCVVIWAIGQNKGDHSSEAAGMVWAFISIAAFGVMIVVSIFGGVFNAFWH